MKNLLDRRWADLCQRLGAEGYATLSQPEKLWLNVRALVDSIENGGLISYFYNSYADTIHDCLKALDYLSAQEIRQQVERVCALFPQGVPGTVEGRNDIIDSWEDDDERNIDALLTEIDEELMPMMSNLEAKLIVFLKRSGLATY